ncbi:hypothetical protein WISP_81052 [Willisornis vidua]|uniref:Uncharacterized protein n=1 Tax=Willisornis vidua TaxID=1566151 RepID=A0ABQ9D4I9_9PASS|nr:hypothetical protein WISP_81052 [Willisornis vidua]
MEKSFYSMNSTENLAWKYGLQSIQEALDMNFSCVHDLSLYSVVFLQLNSISTHREKLGQVPQHRQVCAMYNRYDTLDVEGQSLDAVDVGPSTPELLPRLANVENKAIDVNGSEELIGLKILSAAMRDAV